MNMKIVSLFSGAGGLDLGFKKAVEDLLFGNMQGFRLFLMISFFIIEI